MLKKTLRVGASTPYKRRSKYTMEKIGGKFLHELRGEVHKFPLHCSCSRDVVIDQILGLHYIEISSYDCCYQMSDFKAKYTIFDFGWDSAPDPAWRAYNAPPNP